LGATTQLDSLHDVPPPYWKKTLKQARNETLKVHEMKQLYLTNKDTKVVCFKCYNQTKLWLATSNKA
jgi:hypothetical protein